MCCSPSSSLKFLLFRCYLLNDILRPVIRSQPFLLCPHGLCLLLSMVRAPNFFFCSWVDATPECSRKPLWWQIIVFGATRPTLAGFGGWNSETHIWSRCTIIELSSLLYSFPSFNFWATPGCIQEPFLALCWGCLYNDVWDHVILVLEPRPPA